MGDFDNSKKELAIKEKEEKKYIKKREDKNFNLEENTKEVNKKNVIPWVIGVFLLLAIPLPFLLLKKGLT